MEAASGLLSDLASPLHQLLKLDVPYGEEAIDWSMISIALQRIEVSDPTLKVLQISAHMKTVLSCAAHRRAQRGSRHASHCPSSRFNHNAGPCSGILPAQREGCLPLGPAARRRPRYLRSRFSPTQTSASAKGMSQSCSRCRL